MVVKIYRVRAASTASGFAYVVSWIGAGGRETITRSDLAEARTFAETKARHICNGIAGAALTARSDFIELADLRRLAGEGGASNALAALNEWLEARRIVGGPIVEPCREWAQRRSATVLERIKVPVAIDRFVAEKDKLRAGQGERVYRSKLKYAADQLPDMLLDAVTLDQWNNLLDTFADPVTRNDIRKRLITLCRWARRKRHLPKHVVPLIEETERAKETVRKIGIITPERLRELIAIYLEPHLVKHLGALILANRCGLRVEEIHGKRGDTEQRQRWEDIHLDRGFLSVTAAKENTPSNRIVHLTPSAVAWLKLCPDSGGRVYPRQRGPVCEVNAIGLIRKVAKERGLKLPKNCFRHSWISYRIARTGDKQSTATEAGNSVKEIDKRYRVPLPKHLGEEWEAIMPSDGSGSTPPPAADRSGESAA